MNVIQEIVTVQQGKALTNWTGFSENPTSKEEAQAAVQAIPKRFNYRPKGAPQASPLLTKGVPTELSDSMGLMSGGEAKQCANYLRRYFFRNVVYVRFTKYFNPKQCFFKPTWFCVSPAVSDTQNRVGVINLFFLVNFYPKILIKQIKLPGYIYSIQILNKNICYRCQNIKLTVLCWLSFHK